MANSWAYGDDEVPRSKEEVTRWLTEEVKRVIALDRLKRQGEGEEYDGEYRFCGYSC
jgi:hypothetical protein